MGRKGQGSEDPTGQPEGRRKRGVDAIKDPPKVGKSKEEGRKEGM